MGWCSPQPFLGLFSFQGPSKQSQLVTEVLRNSPPSSPSSLSTPPSREYKVSRKTLSRARIFQQLCCTKYSWRRSPSWMCLRPERIKMPGSYPQAAQTPRELGLDISFQTSGDAGLSISPFEHTTTYFVYKFCLPGFQHERCLKSHWRRSKLRPLQRCQEWNWRSEQRQGSDLPSCPLERLPSSWEHFCRVTWQSLAAGLGARDHRLLWSVGSVLPGALNLIKPDWFTISNLQLWLQDSSQSGSKVTLGFSATHHKPGHHCLEGLLSHANLQ